MKNIYDSPALNALRALDKSPMMRAIRAIEDSPVISTVRNLNNSHALRAIRDLENSPAMQAIRQIKNSSAMRMVRDLEDSPAFKAMRSMEQPSLLKATQQLQNSPAIKAIQALESSPIMQALTTVADRISDHYGALIFSEAYALLIDEYKNQAEEDTLEPLDGLTEKIKSRAEQSPRSPLSAEFYLNIILALFLFYFSQISSEQSEGRIIERMDELERTISLQLGTLRGNTPDGIFLVTGRSVNLRSGPSTDYEVLDILFRNQKVSQLETNGKWVRIEYFDYFKNELKRGWAHRQYFVALINRDN